MRVCTKCHIAKEDSEYFFKNKQTKKLHTQCKQCYKEHRQTYYNAHYSKYRELYLQRAIKQREKLRTTFRKNMLIFLKDKRCVECGEDDIRTFEFDHLNPADKSFDISQSVRLGYSWDNVVKEISKCRILCANCHKKHTSIQFDWYKSR